VADYLKFYNGDKGWERMLDRYGIDAAVLPKSNKILENNGSWEKVFEGNLDIVYVRRK